MPGEGLPGRRAPSDLYELISAVSHELRQPLSSVRGYAEMMIGHWGEFADAEKLRMLEQIRHDAVRAARIMDDLVEMGRLESGRMTLHHETTDLRLVVDRAVRNVRASCPELAPSLQLEETLPAVQADALKLEQVLTNVLDNACKYASPGSVVVSARSTDVGGARMVEVSVRDRGRGIAPGELARVTEKFFRGAGRSGPGMGLGLWISKTIVEAHGGTLVASSDERGVTVTFAVPICRRRPGPAGKLAGP